MAPLFSLKIYLHKLKQDRFEYRHLTREVAKKNLEDSNELQRSEEIDTFRR